MINIEVTGKMPLNPNAIEPAPELLEVQGLMAISASDRARLRDSIAAAGVLDPLRVYRSSRRYFLLSGLNRWEIARELQLATVPVEIIEVAPEHRAAYAITDNLARRHLTTAQKRELVAYLLKLDPTQSNRQVATATGVSPTTAATVRAKLTEQQAIEKQTHRRGADGRLTKAPPATKPNSKKYTKMADLKTASIAEICSTLSDHAERLSDNRQLQLRGDLQELAEIYCSTLPERGSRSPASSASASVQIGQ